MTDPTQPAGTKPPRGPRVDIVVRVEFESEGQLRADFLSNLGTGGMFVRTPVPFTVGQVLSLQLSLPGVIEPAVQVEGVVRWTASQQPEFLRGVGVAFQKVPAELKRLLDRLVVASAPERPPGKGAESSEGPEVRIGLLVANPILQDIIRGELERLARGGASHRACRLELLSAHTVPHGAALAAAGGLDAVIADCDSLKTDVHELGQAVRGAGSPNLSMIVLQGQSGVQAPPPEDARTIVLRKPVSMKALYATLLALCTEKT